MERRFFPEMEVRESRPVATVEEVKAEAERIWAKVRAEGGGGAPGPAPKAGDALLERLQREHANFSRSFPVVVRWMAQLGKYNAKAFERFVRYHAAVKMDTEEDFLKLQAEYPVQYLIEDQKKRGIHNRQAVAEYRTKLLKELKDEREDFHKAIAELEAAQKTEAEGVRRAILESLREKEAPARG